MAVPKIINPAEIDWDELGAWMEENGWQLSAIRIVHEESRTVAELGADLLADRDALDIALGKAIPELINQFRKAANRRIN